MSIFLQKIILFSAFRFFYANFFHKSNFSSKIDWSSLSSNFHPDNCKTFLGKIFHKKQYTKNFFTSRSKKFIYKLFDKICSSTSLLFLYVFRILYSILLFHKNEKKLVSSDEFSDFLINCLCPPFLTKTIHYFSKNSVIFFMFFEFSEKPKKYKWSCNR